MNADGHLGEASEVGSVKALKDRSVRMKKSPWTRKKSTLTPSQRRVVLVCVCLGGLSEKRPTCKSVEQAREDLLSSAAIRKLNKRRTHTRADVDDASFESRVDED